MTDWTSSPYYQNAVRAARRFGVPVSLFTAQIGQESSFNPNAQNGQASGIAQFIPSTAAAFNLNPYDPVAALNAAAQYDSQLYTQTGSWVKALELYGTTSATNPSLAPGVQAQAQAADAGSSFYGNDLIKSIGQWAIGQIPGGTTAQNNIASAAAGTAQAATGLGSAMTFLTDIPRVVTTVLGLIFIIVGLIALTRGPAVNIVSGALKEAATS
ncbi:MAG: transglycosylase SLT domain-containing protein [Patescibacteria group bacterium]|nr:transglycosylase SLT domain-containing protein [Patescibacteria group bacterium]